MSDLYNRAKTDPIAREQIRKAKAMFNDVYQNQNAIKQHQAATPINTAAKEFGLGNGKLVKNQLGVLKTLNSKPARNYRINQYEKGKQKEYEAKKAAFKSNLKKGAIISAISLVTAIGSAFAYTKTDKAKLRALKKETAMVSADFKAGKITEQQAQAKLKAIQKQVDIINARSEKAAAKAVS